MSNSLTLITKNYISNRYEHRFDLYPTEEADWKVNLLSLGILPSFDKLLCRSDGKSTCRKCQAVYAGYQPYCTRDIRYIKVQEGKYYNSWEDSNTRAVGSSYVRYSSRYDVVAEKMDECGGELIWDLEKEWYEQVTTFAAAQMIKNIQSDHTLLSRVTLTPGLYNELRVKYLMNEVSHLTLELSRHRQAIETIMQKMNSAGSHLTW